jgi:biopolymer transport protein ExbB/TolQ
MDTITLSPLALYVHAGLVGKAVMGILLVASIWCWILTVEGIMAALQLRRSLAKAGMGDVSGHLQALVNAGQHALTIHIEGETVGEKRQRLVEAMGREGRKLLSLADKGLPTLAVIASISPFIGLLGTVWGIMSSFADIAGSKDTSLAVVAPGIAEALAATAYGLAAAIPASIGYSKLGASLGRSAHDLNDVIDHLAVILMSKAQSK